MWVATVPLYSFIFQSVLHTEFRYTLPMQYFLFVFAAVAWVALGAVISSSYARRFGRKPMAGRHSN
jgi:hypothetical protein